MKKLFLLAFTLILFAPAFSQKSMNTRKWSKEDKESSLLGQTLFQEGNYLIAIPIFQKLQENHPKELYLKYCLGICGLHRSDLHEQSLELLQEVFEKNKKVYGIKYDLARAYHLNYKFDESLAMLTDYLKNKKLSEKETKAANELINYCNNAKTLVAAPVEAKVENFGPPVNTVSSEYVPVLSSDEKTIIYTYVGEESIGGLQNGFNQPDKNGIYYEDVYISHKDTVWETPHSIGGSINTTSHDAAIGISNDGQKLFIYKDDGYDGGDIYISTLDSITWSSPNKVKGDINTAAWEGSASLSADEKTLYFSSERPGGYGGIDIYKANLLPDGSWGDVQNLGMTVNTAFDEDAPFIHPDGKTLTYSSRGLNSMGGFDIFITEYNSATSSWATPQNLGHPINTTDDDRYFVLSADGNRGYYASGKKGGYGLQDIYVIEMPPGLIKPYVMLVKGTTTKDDKPVKTIITIEKGEDKQPFNTITSNPAQGNYLANLVAGYNYNLTFKLDGYPDQIRNVDARTISSYSEKIIDINFTKIDTTKTDSVVDSVNMLVKVDSAKINTTHTASTKTDSVDDPVNVLAKVDSVKINKTHTPIPENFSLEGLEFKVQIAAYNLPKNYKYAYLKALGKVEKLLLDDGITRFTIGGIFKTMNEAIEHKNKVKSAGQKDAFVTAIYQGKRVYLEDLVKLGVLSEKTK